MNNTFVKSSQMLRCFFQLCCHFWGFTVVQMYVIALYCIFFIHLKCMAVLLLKLMFVPGPDPGSVPIDYTVELPFIWIIMNVLFFNWLIGYDWLAGQLCYSNFTVILWMFIVPSNSHHRKIWMSQCSCHKVDIWQITESCSKRIWLVREVKKKIT